MTNNEPTVPKGHLLPLFFVVGPTLALYAFAVISDN
jgi:hypothetical protein